MKDGRKDGSIHSPEAEAWLRRQRIRLVVRRARQGVLLLALLTVGLWAALVHRADNHTFAWTDPVDVAVVICVDEASADSDGRADRFVQRFISRAALPQRNLRQVEEWFREEHERHTGERREVLRFDVRGPARLREPPPALPEADASFIARLRGTSRFLEFFEAVANRGDVGVVTEAYDVILFVYLYDIFDHDRRDVFLSRESVASRRDRVGIVFAPVSYELLGYTCTLVAHELGHTLGATDKYDGGKSVYPEGYVAPDRTPRLPQPYAEIMALGRPLAAGEEEVPTELDTCRVGDVTAREIGWIRRPDR